MEAMIMVRKREKKELNECYRELTADILGTEVNDILPIRESDREVIDYKLTEIMISGAENNMRGEVLCLRYGLNDGDQKTLKEVGILKGKSRERIRQIEAHGLRFFRHKTFRKPFQMLSRSYLETEVVRLQQRCEELYAKNAELTLLLAKNDFKITLFNSVENVLELSVRTANCLRTANIRTISDLIAKTESELLEVRNLGRKVLNEIKRELHDKGLSLGMQID